MRRARNLQMGFAALLLCSSLFGDIVVAVEDAPTSFKIGGTYYSNKAPRYVIHTQCSKKIMIEDGKGCLQIYIDSMPLKKICGKNSYFTPFAHMCDPRWKRFLMHISKEIHSFIYTDENLQFGVHRGLKKRIQTLSKDIHYGENDKNILLYSESWGALPNKLELIKGKRVIRTVDFNDIASDYAYFVLPMKALKSATAYRIVNANGVVVQKGEIYGQNDYKKTDLTKRKLR